MAAPDVSNHPTAANVFGWGYTDRVMLAEDVEAILAQTFARWDLTGERVLVLLPDGTRTAPIPMLFKLVCDALHSKAARLDFMIALGTHRRMSDQALARHIGFSLPKTSSGLPLRERFPARLEGQCQPAASGRAFDRRSARPHAWDPAQERVCYDQPHGAELRCDLDLRAGLSA